MKTERRHELGTNYLDDWLGFAIERIKPYTSAIVGGLVAVGLLIGAYVFFSTQTQRAEEAGWNLYFTALKSAASTNDLTELSDMALSPELEGTDVANWSRITLADLHYQKGLNALFNDRAAAKEELSKALDSYNYIAEYSGQPLFEQRGILGKARVYESLNDLDNAVKAYAALRDEFPSGVYRVEAENRLRALESQSVKEFYDWFAVQKPRPAESLIPAGRPGVAPDFNAIDSLIPGAGGPGMDDSTIDMPDFGSPGSASDATPESPDAVPGGAPADALPASESESDVAAPAADAGDDSSP